MKGLLIPPLLIFLTGCAQSVFHAGVSSDRGQVSDIEGNQYATVVIGQQTWMAENLRTTRYRDGSTIEDVTVYDNDENNASRYGRLYRWEAISNAAGVCPIGWHVPSDGEWQQLETALGMSEAEAEGTGWRTSADGSAPIKTFVDVYSAEGYDPAVVNASGFSAVPSGARTRRDIFMPFWGGGRYADFWTATAGDDNDAWIRSLVWSPWHPGVDQIFRDKLSQDYGYSIRCVQD